MITQLRGRLVEKEINYVVIDCHGVGYYVNISQATFNDLPSDENVLLYTHFLVREDVHSLYGFSTKSERSVFEFLISVSGVGPASAIVMLSTLSVGDIYSAIANDQPDVLQSVKGIGAKTAQRIILDLKNKIKKQVVETQKIENKGTSKIKIEAISALEVLGIPKKTAEPIIVQLLKDNPALSLEDLIKQTLKKK
ncbi:Holliday junction branch migration protein RuvA [Ornithobacterium rhinotracheale]|uniref:Holliday junction branch migration protein RuvA n=1 Tax=Ornithobacterium rhinotracheale TaxID=28251 RepID=UPI00129D0A48|nr:Holliday junction branch migration protein RuvA [Ornithobacterium rhinotracheale]MRJ07629.1 Holliday junction branch migration protein RuvA [Ornithobacterium rhinotracheale]MRJ10255.1 Holliday junction branch migration protein RuvA [Ornithobacterium rhinotracheale]UOH78227.1 Holliday junction branch migration protein RuvA [Ornithobacterium rhinotracheale]